MYLQGVMTRIRKILGFGLVLGRDFKIVWGLGSFYLNVWVLGSTWIWDGTKISGLGDPAKCSPLIEDRQQLTDELIEPLPRLYAKFGSDREKMILLLQIPRYFDLDSYTVNRGEKHLDDLLHELTQEQAWNIFWRPVRYSTGGGYKVQIVSLYKVFNSKNTLRSRLKNSWPYNRPL